MSGTSAAGAASNASAMSSLEAAQGFNLWGGIANMAINLGSSLYGMYQSDKIAKAQARLAKAQARIQANAYAAEAVGYEQTALRVAQAFGAQEYEIVRQQNAYLEDMALDAAMRGGSMEGTNRYMVSAQEKEFARGNAYARLANDREQANYMSAAQTSMSNAKNAIVAGNIQARSIRSQAQADRTAQFIGLTGSLVGSAANVSQQYYGYEYKKDMLSLQQKYFNLAAANGGVA